jgi:hypothetical protein
MKKKQQQFAEKITSNAVDGVRRYSFSVVPSVSGGGPMFDCLVSTIAIDEVQSTVLFILSTIQSNESKLEFSSKAMFDPNNIDYHRCISFSS